MGLILHFQKVTVFSNRVDKTQTDYKRAFFLIIKKKSFGTKIIKKCLEGVQNHKNLN